MGQIIIRVISPRYLPVQQLKKHYSLISINAKRMKVLLPVRESSFSLPFLGCACVEEVGGMGAIICRRNWKEMYNEDPLQLLKERAKTGIVPLSDL